MFESHEVINEEDAFTLEQFPDCLTTSPLIVLELGLRLFVSVLVGNQVQPMSVLNIESEIIILLLPRPINCELLISHP